MKNHLHQGWVSIPFFKNTSSDGDEHLHDLVDPLTLDTTWCEPLKVFRI